MSSRSSSPKADPGSARLVNLMGAWALAVADRMEAATAAAAGRGGQAPAALIALHEFAGGGTIEGLSHVLGLTHSAAVRLVEGLVADGYVGRGRLPGDRRAVSLALTASGRTAARRIMRARAQAVDAALDGLTDAQRRSLTGLAERLTGDLAALRLDERRQGARPPGGWLCRMCDFEACGRPEGRCPAARRAAGLTST
jgi:MarR family transcriptional regulator, negative regulator of the multidrug operon emrRAB